MHLWVKILNSAILTCATCKTLPKVLIITQEEGNYSSPQAVFFWKYILPLSRKEVGRKLHSKTLQQLKGLLFRVISSKRKLKYSENFKKSSHLGSSLLIFGKTKIFLRNAVRSLFMFLTSSTMQKSRKKLAYWVWEKVVTDIKTWWKRSEDKRCLTLTLNPFRAKPTKWSNKLKQFVCS